MPKSRGAFRAPARPARPSRKHAAAPAQPPASKRQRHASPPAAVLPEPPRLRGRPPLSRDESPRVPSSAPSSQSTPAPRGSSSRRSASRSVKRTPAAADPVTPLRVSSRARKPITRLKQSPVPSHKKKYGVEGCPFPGCDGIGNINRNARTHHSLSTCPLARAAGHNMVPKGAAGQAYDGAGQVLVDGDAVILRPGVVLDARNPVIMKDVGEVVPELARRPGRRSRADVAAALASPSPRAAEAVSTPSFRAVKDYGATAPTGFDRPSRGFYRHNPNSDDHDLGLDYDLESDDECFLAGLCRKQKLRVLDEETLEGYLAQLELADLTESRQKSQVTAARVLHDKRQATLARADALLRSDTGAERPARGHRQASAAAKGKARGGQEPPKSFAAALASPLTSLLDLTRRGLARFTTAAAGAGVDDDGTESEAVGGEGDASSEDDVEGVGAHFPVVLTASQASALLPCRRSTAREVYLYWRDKRRRSGPLLRSLQNAALPQGVEEDAVRRVVKREGAPAVVDAYNRLADLRRGLEQARLIADIARRREKLKRGHIEVTGRLVQAAVAGGVQAPPLSEVFVAYASVDL